MSTPPQGHQTKDLSIQTLRGLACVLVVAFHVRGSPSEGLLLAENDPWSRVVASLIYVRMPLFAFLSGYVYALRPLRRKYPRFVRGKARRLLIPLLVVGTSFAIIQGLAPGTNAPITSEVPWYLWHILPIRHLWFLESIFWVFLLIAALDRFKLLDRLTTVFAIVAAAIALDAILPAGNNILGLRSAVYLLPFFLTGVGCLRFNWRQAPRSLMMLVLVLTLAFSVFTQLGVWGAIDETPGHGPVAALLGIGACLCLVLTRWKARPLVYIGSFAFVIYLVHPIGTAGTRIVLKGLGIESIPVNMILGIVGGLLFGIAIDLLARRFRITRLLVLGQSRRIVPPSSPRFDATKVAAIKEPTPDGGNPVRRHPANISRHATPEMRQPTDPEKQPGHTKLPPPMVDRS